MSRLGREERSGRERACSRSVVAAATAGRRDSNGLRNRDQWPGADWDTTPINAHIAIHHGARVDRLNSTKVTR